MDNSGPPSYMGDRISCICSFCNYSSVAGGSDGRWVFKVERVSTVPKKKKKPKNR